MKLDHTIAAVVTGGASGLGRATVEALRAHGVKVAIFDLDPAAGAAAAEATGALFAQVDVLSEESVAAGFAAARAAHGQERALVNCAGIAPPGRVAGRDKATGAPRLASSEAFARVLMVNTVGTFRCVAHAVAGMMTLDPIEGERGAIVNTSSAAAEDGQIGQAAYAASKAAVMGMTLPLARDLAAEGVRINAIMPGIFATPMMAGMPQPVQDALAATVPFPKRLGDPAEFASLALEMIRNGYFNGASVRLDGAIRMPPK